MPDRHGFVPGSAAAAGNRHDLIPAREAPARLRVPPGVPAGGTRAADGARDGRGFRADLEALGFRPDIPRDPRSKHRPEGRRAVPGRRVAERAHAHLGCAFRGVRARWGRLAASFEAFLAAVAAHRIIARVGL